MSDDIRMTRADGTWVFSRPPQLSLTLNEPSQIIRCGAFFALGECKHVTRHYDYRTLFFLTRCAFQTSDTGSGLTATKHSEGK